MTEPTLGYYVMKNIFDTEFEYQLDLQTTLASCLNLRVMRDTIPERLLFVYNYFTDDLLNLVEKGNVSDTERKRPGLNVRGARLGNCMWCSPESHAAARINCTSDIFSFGLKSHPGLGFLLMTLVCFKVLQKIVFHTNSEELAEAEKKRLVARRLLSHFGDSPVLVGLVEHLDYDAEPWRDLILDVIKEFSPVNPMKPFSM
ncbi:hypothetical protein ACJ72_05941 [Emergomyces africanus]|uniref:Uncharacterized protein n=1 Tax=Emergomyces africanus TaxID=1955775 RepID=A0A1B7NSH2_9EURO|nr:hypothetical protein ACJ72_05941 [Emergomyces africanus]